MVKYGKFYERKNQYDEVIFQDGSDDLPPSVSEGALPIYMKEELIMQKERKFDEIWRKMDRMCPSILVKYV